MIRFCTLSLFLATTLLSHAAQSAIFNGVSDHGTDAYGYYYTVTGGKFPTGPTPNGDNASGGTFRFVADNSADWGRNPAESGLWQKDGWFSDNSGIALTLHNAGAIVYDNNGLEPGASDPADPNYYDYFGGNYPTGGHGAHVAYSMSNNWDWIYAGYFNLLNPTTITSLTGYFAFSGNPADPLTLGFNPNNPAIQFAMNIWSNVAGNLLPTNTGSFEGDVFSSNATAGTFSWSDTGFNRVGSTSTQDIYRLTYTLDNPITLPAGIYWFSHDARIVPEPLSLVVWSLIAITAGAVTYRSRSTAATALELS